MNKSKPNSVNVNDKNNLKNSQYKYLELMGIDVWLSNSKQNIDYSEQLIQSDNQQHELSNVQASVAENNNDFSQEETKIKNIEEKINILHQQVDNCKLCQLCQTRTNIVFGTGSLKAKIMLIGEAPGANEDLQGEPFVGRAGMLLNAMLQAIEINRQNVYIANILKCRPPNNRDPISDEIDLCTPFLRQQIALIKPEIIIAIGKVAASHLLQTDNSMSNLRGKIHEYYNDKTNNQVTQEPMTAQITTINATQEPLLKSIPLFVIYHPAYLLRSPREKSKAYKDLVFIHNFITKKRKQK